MPIPLLIPVAYQIAFGRLADRFAVKPLVGLTCATGLGQLSEEAMRGLCLYFLETSRGVCQGRDSHVESLSETAVDAAHSFKP